MPVIHRVYRFAKQYIILFLDTDISGRAAALAFHTILAIIPSLGLVFWYLSSIGVTQHWLDLSRAYILSHLNIGSGDQFRETFDTLTSKMDISAWGYVGVALLIYTLSNLLVKFGDSLDHVLGNDKKDHLWNRSFLKLTLFRLLVMVGLPIALCVSLAVSQWIRQDSWLHYLFDLSSVGSYFAYPIPIVVDIMVFYSIYYFVPKRRVSARQALLAAVVAAPSFEILRWGFGVYNNYAVSVHKLYGVFAVLPMFILWVQVAWMLMLGCCLLMRKELYPKKAKKLSS